MSSEEMTTGSVKASEAERKALAGRTRWWNSTGGGSTKRTLSGQQNSNSKGFGAIKAGDGGQRFKEQFPELDEENWKEMEKKRIDPQTGKVMVAQEDEAQQQSCSPETAALSKGGVGSAGGLGAVVDGGREARDAGQGFVRRNAWTIVGVLLFVYVLATRLLSDQE